MKLKLVDILNAKDIINKLGNMTFRDGATAYKMMRNIRNITPELKDFDIVKNQIMDKYGTKLPDGSIQIPANKKDEYFKDINKLIEEEIEVNISLINPDEITDFAPFELMIIEWMLEPRKEV
jgi:hypothetical protein